MLSARERPRPAVAPTTKTHLESEMQGMVKKLAKLGQDISKGNKQPQNVGLYIQEHPRDTLCPTQYIRLRGPGGAKPMRLWPELPWSILLHSGCLWLQ